MDTEASAKSKSNRVLELYRMFIEGKVVNKSEQARYYGVNEKSIQRDIDSIRDFLADQHTQQGLIQSIEYDTKGKGYKLVSQRPEHLTKGEVLAICKILIESKAFSKEDLESLIARTLNLCLSPADEQQTKQCISNELYNYINPAHPPLDTTLIWKVEQAIKEQQIVEVTYTKVKDKSTVTRRLQPVGLLFSEFYFYLMGIIEDTAEREKFKKQNDPYPTIYRLDRINGIEFTGEHFSIPYRDRFKEGEYKNRVQYMYGGEIQHLEFKFYGPSIEAVLDKLPMATITNQEQTEEGNTVYTVNAEVFGHGILMWLLSQGSKVEVLKPQSIKEQWLKEVQAIISREQNNEDRRQKV